MLQLLLATFESFVLLDTMHGLSTSIAERFSLFCVTLGILCLGDRTEFTSPSPYRLSRGYNYQGAEDAQAASPSGQSSSSTDSYAQGPNQSSTSQASRQPKYTVGHSRTVANKRIYIGNSQKRSLSFSAAQTSKNIGKMISQTNILDNGGWYYAWLLKIASPLPIPKITGSYTFQDYAQEVDTVQLYFELESPYSEKWGSMAVRSLVPFHLLWQDQRLSQYSSYPVELNNTLSDASSAQQQLLGTLYHSSLYLSWGIPDSKFGNMGPDHGSYLQFGSIWPRSDSPWSTLQSSLLFPSSTQTIASLPSPARQADRLGQKAASTRYNGVFGLGESIGFSCDSSHFHALLLHQRSSSIESLSTGLGLRFDYISPEATIKASNGQQIAFQNFYRLHTASLFTQNLSRVDTSRGPAGDWYFASGQERQNSARYLAAASERWSELLRYDRAVKQFYFQASWKYMSKSYPHRQNTATEISVTPELPKLPEQSSYFQLSTEQGLSVSPIDYWGNLQKYYFKLYLPIIARQYQTTRHNLRLERLALSNESYITYSDANWVNAQRNLANSVLNQWYGRKLNLQNRLSLHFRQNIEAVAAGAAQDHHKGTAAGSRQLAKRQREQILRIETASKTIRFLHSAQTNYLNFGLQYYWIWGPEAPAVNWRTTSLETQAGSTWHLSLRMNLEQEQLKTSDIQPKLQIFPTPLWQRELELSFGWQQQPSNRIPKLQIANLYGTAKNMDKYDQSAIQANQGRHAQESKKMEGSKPRPKFPSSVCFGWKTLVASKEAHLADEELLQLISIYQDDLANLEQLEGKLQLSFFSQIWYYGSHSHGNSSIQSQKTGWWKFFQLQLDLSLNLSFFRDQLGDLSACLAFQTRLQAQLQLPKHWLFVLAVELDDWQLEQGLNHSARIMARTVPIEKVSIHLALRYEIRSKHVAKSLPHLDDTSGLHDAGSIEDQNNLEDPLEKLEQPFRAEEHQAPEGTDSYSSI